MTPTNSAMRDNLPTVSWLPVLVHYRLPFVHVCNRSFGSRMHDEAHAARSHEAPAFAVPSRCLGPPNKSEEVYPRTPGRLGREDGLVVVGLIGRAARFGFHNGTATIDS